MRINSLPLSFMQFSYKSIKNQSLCNKFLVNKITYFIHIDSLKTPNPNFLKFVPEGQNVLGDKGTLDISSLQYANISPLAEDLFKIQGVTRVFLGNDYLSVAKQDKVQWGQIKPYILGVLNDYFQNKRPILSATAILEQHDQIDPNDSETVQFIKQIIASRIRPTVQEDGGDVKFISFDEQTGVLTLRMMGSCSGCPSSAVTLKQGIQKMLVYYVKQIKQVIAQNQ